MPPKPLPVAAIPLGGKPLTPAEWARIEKLLDTWKGEVLTAARRHPARSYRLGVEQVEAFARLVTEIPAVAPLASMFGGHGPSAAAAVKWQQTYTLHELDDALNVYIGKIKDALLYGLRHQVNPVEVASWLYNATRDASVNWRAIARTEMARANAVGRLQACKAMGFEQVWVPPHIGSCASCKRLLENQVFDVDELLNASNYGRPEREWVPCCPLHPHCRHSYLPYIAEVYDAAMEHYSDLEAAGLTDPDRIDELYDSSGQLRDGMALSAEEEAAATWKTHDPYAEGLAAVVYALATPVDVAKTDRALDDLPVQTIPLLDLHPAWHQRAIDPEKILAYAARIHAGENPPPIEVHQWPDGRRFIENGQHRAWAARLAGRESIRARIRDVARPWDDLSEQAREVCAKAWDPWATDVAVDEPVEKMPTSIDAVLAPEHDDDLSTAYSDGLDPLLWDGLRLRDDVALALEQWWQQVAGERWREYSVLLMPAHSRVPIVVCDYDAMRRARPEWAHLGDDDLHFALIAAVAAHRGQREIAPGLPLDVRLVPLHVPGSSFGDAIATLAPGPTWDLHAQTWIRGLPDGDQLDAAKVIGEYSLALDAPSEVAPEGSRPNFQPLDLALADRLVDQPVVGKAAPTQPRVPAGTPAQGNIHPGEFAAAPTHRLYYSMSARNQRDKLWGRGLIDPHGNVHTWPETDGRHIEMAQAKGLDPRRCKLFSIRPDGWVAFNGQDTESEHGEKVMEADDRLWTTAASYRGSGFKKTADDEDLDVAKMGAAPNVGVEHWITVHPHGDGDKGQPVLVRNNSDGTMSVIGGAGGNLNYLRLDPSRRITSSESTKRGKERDGHKSQAAQVLSPEEQAAQEQQHRQARAQANKTIEKAEAKKQTLHEQLRALVAEQIGAKWLTHGLIRHADGTEEEYELSKTEQRQALRKLTAGAVQTLTMGEQAQRDAQDGGYLFTERQGDFEGMPDGEKADEDATKPTDATSADEPAEPGNEDTTSVDEDLAQERKINKRLPAMSTDQAEAIMGLERQIAKLSRVQAKARKLLAGGQGTAGTALAMEWTDAEVKDDVAKKIEAEQRTQAARELLDTADKNTYRVQYGRSLHRGAFDTVDAFTHAVLGQSALSPEVAKLLGPTGAAQMVAHAIHQRATALGDPDKLDLDKPMKALQQLTAGLEADVANKATARARRAMEVAVQMRGEQKASTKGESLWTKTSARSYEIQKCNEAANQLGMAIGGFQAASALQQALEKPPKEIVVSGISSPSEIHDLAARAKIKLQAGQIEREGSGNYTLRMQPEQLQHLFSEHEPPNWQKRDTLRAIRTGKGKGIGKAIEKARATPGMFHTLSPAQAQGKMFLLASGEQGTNRHWNLTGTPIEKKAEDLRAQIALGQTLDFAPGVGKTHTGIAAAMQLMHDEPEKNHRVLVVAPTTAIGPWAGTVMAQNSKSVQVLGAEAQQIGGVNSTKVDMRKLSGKRRRDQYDSPADFNIIGHEMLQRDPELAKKLGATIVIVDEAQKYKNERNEKSSALRSVGDAAGVARPKVPSRTAYAEQFHKGGELGVNEHLTREDKIRQHREQVLDENLFHMDAATAGNDLPDREKGTDNDPLSQKLGGYTTHKVDLDPEHREHLHGIVKNLNDWRDNALATGGKGPAFGGAPILRKALYDRPGNALAQKAAEVMAKRLEDKIEWDGFKDHADHADGEAAGSYERKGIIFSQYTQPLDHLMPELKAKGLKVFYAHGGLSNEENERVLNSYLAHKGKAVLVTSDKNSTARSLQFGDNGGKFQHGATAMLHYSLPDNLATIQQREARIHRRGAQVPVSYDKLDAGTPAEARQRDRLEQEARVQDLSGNSEQLVGGKDTLRHRLAREGVAPANELGLDRDGNGADDEDHERS